MGTVGRVSVSGAGTEFPHFIAGTTRGDPQLIFDEGRYSNQTTRLAGNKTPPNSVYLLGGFNSGITTGSTSGRAAIRSGIVLNGRQSLRRGIRFGLSAMVCGQ